MNVNKKLLEEIHLKFIKLKTILAAKRARKEFFRNSWYRTLPNLTILLMQDFRYILRISARKLYCSLEELQLFSTLLFVTLNWYNALPELWGGKHNHQAYTFEIL